MQATIKYPAAGQESYWQKGEDGKAVCRITVTGDDGKDYKVRIQEGTLEWAKVKGDPIAIELRTNRQTNEQYAVLEGTPQTAPRQGGSGYSRRAPLTPEQQTAEAQRLVPLMVSIYRNLDATFEKHADSLHHKPTAEDIRSMSISILIQISER